MKTIRRTEIDNIRHDCSDLGLTTAGSYETC